MKISVNLDALGIVTSVACAIHCAVLPLLISSLPLLGVNIIHNKYFEYGMIIVAFAIGSFSLYHGRKSHHHRPLPLLIFSFGFLCLILKQILVNDELVLLLPAVSLILAAHFLNYRLCRKGDHSHAADCNH